MIGHRERMIQIKLEHMSGTIKCSPDSKPTFWGCEEKRIQTIIGDEHGNVLFKQELMPGYDVNSKFIVFNKMPSDAPRIPMLPWKLRIWFDKDMIKETEKDNTGSIKVKVFLTMMESRKEKQGLFMVVPPDLHKTPSGI